MGDLSSFGYTADGTSKAAIEVVAMSSTPMYQGFKIGIGGKGIPKTSIFGGGSFKASLNMTGSPGLQQVTVPIGHFSYDWSGFTGDCNTHDPKRGFNQQHYC